MKKHGLLILLSLLWISVLVWFSLQPKLPIDAKEHARWIMTEVEKRYTVDHLKNQISAKVVVIEPGIAKFYSFYGMQYNNLPSAFNFLIRKAGHFTVYFILGLLLFFSLKKWVRSPYPWALLLGLLFALFDELNQFYAKGRTSMIQDVLVDFAGVVSALLCIAVCTGIYRGTKQIVKKGVFVKK